MNFDIFAQKPASMPSQCQLGWAGTAAVAACTAACSAPLLLAALGGAAGATLLAGVAGAGAALTATLGLALLRGRRTRTAGAHSGTHSTEPPPALPIVCDPTLFSKEERAAHLEQTKQLLLERPTRRQELETGIEFYYTATDDLFLALAAWAQFEHRCCAWAHFALELEPFAAGSAGGMRLRITGSPELSVLLLDALRQLEARGPMVEEFLRGESVLTAGSRPRCGPVCGG